MVGGGFAIRVLLETSGKLKNCCGVRRGLVSKKSEARGVSTWNESVSSRARTLLRPHPVHFCGQETNCDFEKYVASHVRRKPRHLKFLDNRSVVYRNLTYNLEFGL